MEVLEIVVANNVVEFRGEGGDISLPSRNRRSYPLES